MLSDIKLSIDDGPTVTVLQRLGLPDEHVAEVAWAELDREVERRANIIEKEQEKNS